MQAYTQNGRVCKRYNTNTQSQLNMAVSVNTEKRFQGICEMKKEKKLPIKAIVAMRRSAEVN